jgi:hypothetical protein
MGTLIFLSYLSSLPVTLDWKTAFCKYPQLLPGSGSDWAIPERFFTIFVQHSMGNALGRKFLMTLIASAWSAPTS